MKIAVIGGVGAGKSTIIKMLKSLQKGYLFYSVDSMVGELYEESSFMEFLSTLGIHSKKEASEIAFENPYILQLLEEKTEPLIKPRINRMLELQNIVLEFPLLYKYPEYHDKFDVIVSVRADYETRVKRIMDRSNVDRYRAEMIIHAQAPQHELDTLADIVFDNTTDDTKELLQNIKELVAHIVRIHTLKKSKIEKQAEVILEQVKPQNMRKPKVGVMPGSFDPLTIGHLHVAEKALDVVDILHVVVAHNPNKQSFIDIKDRVNLIKKSILESLGSDRMAQVRVEVLEQGEALVMHAQKVGAKFIFRGIRNSIDLEYEHSINFAQNLIDPSIETLYILTPQKYTQISSSLVRELYKLRGTENVWKGFVPDAVFQHLTRCFGNK